MEKKITIAKLTYIYFFNGLLRIPFFETESHLILKMLFFKVVSIPFKKLKVKICLDENYNCKKEINIGGSGGYILSKHVSCLKDLTKMNQLLS
jgi:hypothetical protein